MYEHDKIRARLFDKAGIVENPIKDSLSDLKKTEWSFEFETLMRNRMLIGAFRYGRLSSDEKPSYDRVGGIENHLSSYRIDGNTEHLVDIANLALCEFVEGNHPKCHFRSVDDGEHVKLKNGD